MVEDEIADRDATMAAARQALGSSADAVVDAARDLSLDIVLESLLATGERQAF